MFPKDLMSFIKVYTGVFDNEFCQSTIKNLEKCYFEKHHFHSYQPNLSKSYNDDLSVTWGDIPEKKIIREKIWYVIEKYVLNDLAKFQSIFNGWNGYNEIRFNKYNPGTCMHEHVDHISDLFDGSRRGIPILSVVGALNDDYQGGQFVMWNDTIIDIPTGAVLLFPSVFLYPHSVRHVTAGTRYTFVTWVY